MKVILSLGLTLVACFVVLQAATPDVSHPVPQYTKDGRLVRPKISASGSSSLRDTA